MRARCSCAANQTGGRWGWEWGPHSCSVRPGRHVGWGVERNASCSCTAMHPCWELLLQLVPVGVRGVSWLAVGCLPLALGSPGTVSTLIEAFSTSLRSVTPEALPVPGRLVFELCSTKAAAAITWVCWYQAHGKATPSAAMITLHGHYFDFLHQLQPSHGSSNINSSARRLLQLLQAPQQASHTRRLWGT
jgi:hypothetical protein